MSHPRRLAAGFCAALIACTGLMALAGSAGAAIPSAAGTGEEQEEAVAKLVILEPGASIRREGKTEFKPAKDGANLRVGDTVQTDGTGFVEIRYTDDSFTRLDVNTTFTILSLTDDQGNRKINGSLESGQAWNRTSALTESESFEQEGAGATAAVVGTAYLFQCDGLGHCVIKSAVDGVQFTSVDGEVQFLDPLEQCNADEITDTDTDLCDEPTPVPPSALGAFGALNLYLDSLEGLPGLAITGTIIEQDDGTFVVVPNGEAMILAPVIGQTPIVITVPAAGPSDSIDTDEVTPVTFFFNVTPASGSFIVFNTDVLTLPGFIHYQTTAESDIVNPNQADRYDATQLFIFVPNLVGSTGGHGAFTFVVSNGGATSQPGSVDVNVDDVSSCYSAGPIDTAC